MSRRSFCFPIAFKWKVLSKDELQNSKAIPLIRLETKLSFIEYWKVLSIKKLKFPFNNF